MLLNLYNIGFECSGIEFDIVRFSLFQDILSIIESEKIHRVQADFIYFLQDKLDINPEQRSILEKMVLIHKKMKENNKEKITELIEYMEKVLKLGRIYGIPESAVFISGSLYTLDTYKQFKRISKKRTKTIIDSQRELLLADITKNMQKQITNMAVDVNAFAIGLIEEIQSGENSMKKIEEFKKVLKNLGERIGKREEKIKFLEEVVCLLRDVPPLFSSNDIGRIREQIGDEKADKIKECYEEDGRLKDKLDIEYLRELKEIFVLVRLD